MPLAKGSRRGGMPFHAYKTGWENENARRMDGRLGLLGMDGV